MTHVGTSEPRHRRQFHKVVSLGVDVHPEIFFARINPEVLRDATIYEKQFVANIDDRSRLVAKTQFYGRNGVILRGKQRGQARSALFPRNAKDRMNGWWLAANR